MVLWCYTALHCQSRLSGADINTAAIERDETLAARFYSQIATHLKYAFDDNILYLLYY